MAQVQCYGPHPPDQPPTRHFEASRGRFEADSSLSIPNLADRTATSLTAQLRPWPRALQPAVRAYPDIVPLLLESALMDPFLAPRPSTNPIIPLTDG